MRIVGTVITKSRVADDVEVGSTIERVAHESMRVEVRSPDLRVLVNVHPSGEVTVDTFRLAPGGDPNDTDRIVWNDDASIVLNAHSRPTVVTSPRHCVPTLAVSEPAPF